MKLNMKLVKHKRIIVQVVLVFLFIIILYFLLPYILQFVGVNAHVVLTNSMEHKKVNQSFFELFWRNRSVEPTDLPYKHGFNVGDLIIVSSSQNYSIGDIIATKRPREQNIRTHRMYDYNLTHFRDIGDTCFQEKMREIVWLVVRNNTEKVISTDDPESFPNAKKIYQGPAYHGCINERRPSTHIKGKIVWIFPRAGLLHILLYPSGSRSPW